MTEGKGSFNDLDAVCLARIFSYLPPVDVGRAACVHTLWNRVSRESPLWQSLCSEDYCFQGPPPRYQQQEGWRLCYSRLRNDLGAYGPLGVRACHVFKQFRTWAQSFLPDLPPTLRPGVSEEALDAAEADLEVKLPPAVRAVWRTCDGQALEWHPSFPAPAFFGRSVRASPPPNNPVLGLLGGVGFYEYLAVTRLLPLEQVVATTLKLRPFLRESRLVIIGLSHQFARMVLVNVSNGTVMVQAGERTPLAAEMPWPVVPASHPDPAPSPSPIAAVAHERWAASRAGLPPHMAEKDGLLRWLEAFAARLVAGGKDCVQRWAPDNGEGISLFGLRKPGTGSDDMQASSTTYRYTPAGLEVEEPAGAAEGFQEKVTRGVAVRASARLIADRSHVVRGEIKRFLFAYSIRFSLLPVDQQQALHQQAAVRAPSPHSGQAFRPLHSVQLQSRHWKIWGPASGGLRPLLDEVDGEAVIGAYPLLRAGGEEFIYQSCTPAAQDGGAMSGWFTFVEGSLTQPTGPEFEAMCPLFHLKVPEDYLF